ncbi:MAG: hypothetical protein Q8N97_05245 [Methanobacteriaceae archaeon]|nr:hypothetical protein [Methanobacteriaceae archaeon]
MVNSKGSEYPGVYKEDEGWSAYITINGEQKCLGVFKIEENAAITYLVAKSEAKLKNKKVE